MAHIKPFRAFRYDTERVRFDDVVAPPYDVISEPERDALYERSPFNIIRIILGRGNERYRDADELFRKWKADGILVRDDSPAMYLVAQKFQRHDGVEVVRNGIIAAFQLEELGAHSVFPHERTLSTPKEDRLKLLNATGAMFSQIFGLYADPSHTIDRLFDTARLGPPALTTTYEGVENLLWKITDQQSLLRVQADLTGRNILIADGHHRYETALAYASNRRSHDPNHSGKEAYNFVPMYLTNIHNPGIAVLPTHRLVHGVAGFSPEQTLADLSRSFFVTPVGSLDELLVQISRPTDPPLIGMLIGNRQKYYLLRPSGRQTAGGVKRFSPADMIDVVLLERLVFTELFGMTVDDILTKRYIDYEKDAEKCMTAVTGGSAQAAFLLQPPSLDRIKAAAEAGVVLPQKSTYFYPKLLSGTVMYSFADND